MAEENKQTYKLKDVDVLTVGLVSKGANRKKFFMTKSENQVEERNMAEQDDVQTTIPAPVEITDEMKELSKQAATEAVTEASENAVKAFFKNLLGSAESKNDDNADDTPSGNIVVIPEEIQKKLDAVDQLQKSHQELAEELRQAKEELAKANSDAVEKTFLAKASLYKSVGADRQEVADFMVFLNKADNAKLEWFENFVKGVDAQLAEAGIYSEFGKQDSPEQDDDPVQALIKSGEAKDEKEAYLKLGEDQEKANALLKQRRTEIRTG